MDSFKFDDVYRLLQLIGPTTISLRTMTATVIDVWASKLLSGNQKGQRVIRVQWGRSSSTLSEYDWERPRNGLERRAIAAVYQALAHSTSIAQRARQSLEGQGSSLSEGDIELLHRVIGIIEGVHQVSPSSSTNEGKVKAPIIDTLEVLELAQQALTRCESTNDRELYRTALSALSALMPYIKQPTAPVQQKHYDAIDVLRRAMKEMA